MKKKTTEHFKLSPEYGERQNFIEFIYLIRNQHRLQSCNLTSRDYCREQKNENFSTFAKSELNAK